MLYQLKKIGVCAVLVLFVTVQTTFASPLKSLTENSVGAEQMMVDFALVRPVGIAASAASSVFFIVSLPFSLLGGNVSTAFQKLVAEPLAFTYTRPLGDFSQIQD